MTSNDSRMLVDTKGFTEILGESAITIQSQREKTPTVLPHSVESRNHLFLGLVRKIMQFPIYYLNRTLASVETRNPHLEKLVLALVLAARKLKLYSNVIPSTSLLHTF